MKSLTPNQVQYYSSNLFKISDLSAARANLLSQKVLTQKTGLYVDMKDIARYVYSNTTQSALHLNNSMYLNNSVTSVSEKAKVTNALNSNLKSKKWLDIVADNTSFSLNRLLNNAKLNGEQITVSDINRLWNNTFNNAILSNQRELMLDVASGDMRPIRVMSSSGDSGCDFCKTMTSNQLYTSQDDAFHFHDNCKCIMTVTSKGADIQGLLPSDSAKYQDAYKAARQKAEEEGTFKGNTKNRNREIMKNIRSYMTEQSQ